jgi:hypothetical protein
LQIHGSWRRSWLSVSLGVRRNRVPFAISADLRHEGKWQQGRSLSRTGLPEA